MPSSPGLPSFPPGLALRLVRRRLVALPERRVLIGEGRGGDLRRRLVEVRALVQRPVLGRVEQLLQELVPGLVGAGLDQLRARVEGDGVEVGGGDLVDLRVAEPLALRDQVPAAPGTPLVHHDRVLGGGRTGLRRPARRPPT